MSEAKNKLGNKCNKCGSTENLDFDHIDRKTKSFTIGSDWNKKESVFWEEVNKCQLLCRKCHNEKTLIDLGQVSAKETHGTLSSYRYCNCVLCRKANANYCREKRRKKRLRSDESPDTLIE